MISMFAKNRNPRPQNKIYEKQAKNITLVGTCPHSNKSKIRCKHWKIDTPNAYTLRSCKWFAHASKMLTLTYNLCRQRCYKESYNLEY